MTCFLFSHLTPYLTQSLPLSLGLSKLFFFARRPEDVEGEEGDREVRTWGPDRSLTCLSALVSPEQLVR